MKKFGWALLNILTLGIPYAVAKHRAKKQASIPNTTLKVASDVNFDINQLILVLGGSGNIVDLSATISTVKINLKDASFLTREQFASFKTHGFMKNKNQVILVFGDNSQAICSMIQDKIHAQSCEPIQSI